MTTNNPAKQKLEGFISELKTLGYTVEPVHKKPQIYSINGSLVNIRSRGKIRQSDRSGRSFWYSVTFGVLKEVKWVIYLTTEADYFVMVPSSLLESLKDKMYPDKSKAATGIFDINWDDSTIKLRGESVYIKCYSLKDKEEYPNF